jgi:hypothetical protein
VDPYPDLTFRSDPKRDKSPARRRCHRDGRRAPW